MFKRSGIYHNGLITLDRNSGPISKSMKVTVTFHDADDQLSADKPLVGQRIKLSDFSFQKSRDLSKAFKGSLADAVLEERRSQ